MGCGAGEDGSSGGGWLNSGYRSSGWACRLPGGKVGPVQGPRTSNRRTSVICIPRPCAVTIRCSVVKRVHAAPLQGDVAYCTASIAVRQHLSLCFGLLGYLLPELVVRNT